MAKPQDLPAGESQMVLAIAINFITYVLALLALDSLGNVALHAAIDIGLSGMCLYFALKFTNNLPRFHQAFGAICGAGAILNFAAIPMLRLTATPANQAGESIAILASFILLVWSFSIIAHVLRHTFNIRMTTSIGFAVLYYVLVTTVLAALIPLPPEEDVSHYESGQPALMMERVALSEDLFVAV